MLDEYTRRSKFILGLYFTICIISLIYIVLGISTKNWVTVSVAGFIGFVCLVLFVIVYRDKKSLQTCNPDLWKRVRDNVLLPVDLSEPDYIQTTLCDAQKYVQYSEGTGFFYDGSNVYVINDNEPSITRSPTSNYSFYFLSKKDIKPKIINPVSPSPATATTTTTTSSTTQNDASCCFRNNNNECIIFENTFVGNSLNREISDFFVNRAGKNFGSEVYIGDFTSMDLSGNTKLLFKQSQLLTAEPPNTNASENIPTSDFSWPVCVPQNIKNMNVKRIRTLSEEYKKTVKLDAWFMRAYIEHKIYIAKNGSPTSYFVVPNTPYKYTLQIKGTGLFDEGTRVKYNDEEFITLQSITTTLRNKLIAE